MRFTKKQKSINSDIKPGHIFKLKDAIEVLFSGKVDLDDIPILIQMKKDGLIQKPKFFPEWVTDMNYLVSYFVFSNFVGKMDYDSVDDYYDSLF